MDAETWRRAKIILAEIVEVLPTERAAYLDQHCADPDLRREVDGLLQYLGDDDFLESIGARYISRSESGGDDLDLPRGMRVGRYLLGDRLGEGGMGVVYRASDELLARDVAVKVLKSQDDPQAVQRFFREARAASALNHPNIVTVFEAGEAEWGHFIVMERVRGRGLRSLIGQAIEVEQLVSLARQTAEALAVAHQAGIVHR